MNWYPWGEEALSEANKQNKPILLSIGYSACHWYHVMAHEPFENEDIASSAKALTKALAQLRQKEAEKALPTNLLKHSVAGLSKGYDRERRGFGTAPKFPGTPSLKLLLYHFYETGDNQSLKMACHSLQQMAWGGMRDQLAGGFHRYFVDAGWQIPHFGKRYNH